jgi:hypothetical protein
MHRPVALPTTNAATASGRAGTPVIRGAGFNYGSMMNVGVSARRVMRSGRLRGLGQDASSIDLSQIYPVPGAYSGWDATTPATLPSPTSTGFNWQTFLQPLVTAGAQIGKQFASYANPLYNLAPGTYYQQTPYGTVVSTAGVPGSVGAALGTTNLMPILLIGGGVLLVAMMAGKR